MTTRLAVAGVCLVMLFGVSVSRLAAQASPLSTRRPLVFLADEDYPPLSYVEDGAVTGIDVEIARSLSRVLGRDVRVEATDWQTAQERVLRGEGDGLLSMSMTQERRARYGFSDPIVNHEFGFFVRTGNPKVNSVVDLSGRKVGVTSGGIPRRLLASSSNADLVPVPNYGDGFAKLAAGELDAIAADVWVGAYTIEQRGFRNIVRSGPVFATLQGGIAVAKGNDALVNDINRALDALRGDGTIDRILAKWRPKEVVFVTRERMRAMFVFAIAVFLALLGLGANAIRRQRRAQVRHRQAEERIQVLVQVIENTNDVTDQKKQLEAQLLQAQKMEAVGRLAGGMAHDFNNILTVIMASAELAASELENESPVQRDLQQILTAAHSAASLTRQLLIFSRKSVATPTVIELNDTIRRLGKMLRRLVGEDIEITCVSRPDAGHVKIDPTQLEQVVMNLVVNARDAMPSGGQLTIETGVTTPTGDVIETDGLQKTPGEFATLKVADTGVGMTPEVQAQIFEPFFTTKDSDNGTGLGLAMVDGIVRQAGGFVRFESAPGVGTTFTVHLPKIAPGDEVARDVGQALVSPHYA